MNNEPHAIQVSKEVRILIHSDNVRQVQILKEITKRNTDTTEKEWVFSGWFGEYNDKSMLNHIVNLIRDDEISDLQVSDLDIYFEKLKESIQFLNSVSSNIIKQIREVNSNEDNKK